MVKQELLINLDQRIKDLDAKVDSIIIEQNGVVEKTYNDIYLHELRSCSKLLVAFSIGILVSGGGTIFRY